MRPTAVTLFISGVFHASELDLPSARQAPPYAGRGVEPAQVAEDQAGVVDQTTALAGLAAEDDAALVSGDRQAQKKLTLAPPGGSAKSKYIGCGLIRPCLRPRYRSPQLSYRLMPLQEP